MSRGGFKPGNPEPGAVRPVTGAGSAFRRARRGGEGGASGFPKPLARDLQWPLVAGTPRPRCGVRGGVPDHQGIPPTEPSPGRLQPPGRSPSPSGPFLGLNWEDWGGALASPPGEGEGGGRGGGFTSGRLRFAAPRPSSDGALALKAPWWVHEERFRGAS